jgi:putative membrane-bound dehydrogenase-like protein
MSVFSTHRCCCVFFLLLGTALTTPTRAANKPVSVAPILFDGKSLSGWSGNPDLWRVEAGELVGTIKKELADNEFLIHNVPLGDFRLVVEVKLSTRFGQNSGIQFRSQPVDDKGHTSVKGYQADVGGTNGEYWCDVYDEHGRGWLFTDGPPSSTGTDTWHTYEIVAVGNTIMAALDGESCFKIEDPGGPKTGIIALQLHSGPAMEVRYRNFEITLNPEKRLVTNEAEEQRLRNESAPALTPQESVRRMTVPKGFAVDLIAAEPRVQQPIAFTFDERGRIWVAEAYSYPVRAPEGKGKDRLVILEDRDGNGSFETRKVFAENLNLVSGFEVGFGGVFVGAAPQFLFLSDRDHNDVPDGPPVVLLDGFDTSDTHETPNAFIWGPDGWLYGNQGVFNESVVGKPGTSEADRVEMGPGIWRYHPTKQVFEVFADGGSNQWGLDFDPSGQAFITTCRSFNGGGMATHIAQGGSYWRQAGQYPSHVYRPIKAAADHDHGIGGAGGSLKHGGHSHVGTMIYQGDNWPEAWRGKLFTHNLHGGLINVERLVPKGSGFVVKHVEEDILRVNDPWFVGVALKSGPDGAMYMIDWYDRQHCHHRDVEKWDRSNGRLYRVAYGTPARRGADLGRATDTELVAMQSHDNEWHARTARRLLQERAATGKLEPTAIAPLHEMLKNGKSTRDRLRALWALHAVGGIDTKASLSLLADPDEMLRAWTVALLTEKKDTATGATLTAFVKMAKMDPSPVVRRYLASALQRIPNSARSTIVSALAAHTEDAGDANIAALVWSGFEPLVSNDLHGAIRLAEASKLPELRYSIYRRSAEEPKGLNMVVAQLGRANQIEQANILGAVYRALEGQTGLKMPPSWKAVSKKLYTSKDASVLRAAQILAAQFGDTTVLRDMRKTLADRKARKSDRTHAFRVLEIARDPSAVPVLQNLLTDGEFNLGAVKALARYDHVETPARVLGAYAEMPVSVQAAALETLTTRSPYALALLTAIEAGTVPKKDLNAFYARQIARFDEPEIKAKLTTLFGANREQSEDSAALIKQYRALWNRASPWIYSASRGREVYNKLCAQCHTLFGEGGRIGPDLTGSPRHDIGYLLDNIVDPSQLIGKDFQPTVVETRDGQFLSGLLMEENDRTIKLQTLTDPVIVEKKNITVRALADSSMMPEGLLQTLTDAEIQNLLRYLSSPEQVSLPTGATTDRKP